MRKKLIFIAPLAVLAMLVFVTIGGTIVQHLWNWLLPPLLGLRSIGFWQALGILALCRILFGGLGCRTSVRSRILSRMQERCGNMTPEERERFRQGIRDRFGCGPSTGGSQGAAGAGPIPS